MRLALQKYPITVVYVPWKELFIADALSHFPQSEKLKEEENLYVIVLQYINVFDEKVAEILYATQQDNQLQKLQEYVETFWPERKAEVDEQVHEYWSYKEVHTQEGLLSRSNRIIIPKSMRSSILLLLHASHSGEEKMEERARDVMF